MKGQLAQRLYNDVLNIVQRSRTYDERLGEPMVTSYLTGQLISFADGLVEYTEQRLQGLPPEPSAVPVPFNLLSEQILDINIYEVHRLIAIAGFEICLFFVNQCGHLCWLVVERYIEQLPFLEDIVWIPLQYLALVLPAVLYHHSCSDCSMFIITVICVGYVLQSLSVSDCCLDWPIRECLCQQTKCIECADKLWRAGLLDVLFVHTPRAHPTSDTD